MTGLGPKVSVIIPAYNRADLLRRSIDSVLAQTYRNFEVIIVDDASSDNTAEVVEGFQDSRVRYLCHESNKGAPTARNTGINAARAEFIAFQDSDDVWKPDKLTKQMARFDANPSLAVVYCGLLRHDNGRTTYIPDRRIKTRKGDIFRALLHGNFVSTQTLVVRRSALAQIGGFVKDLPRYQDWELAIRLSRVYPFDLVDEALVHIYSTLGNITSDGPAGLRAIEMILADHYDVISEDRKALAGFFFKIGFFRSLFLDGENARSYFVKAIRTAPWSLRAWVGLLLSCLGHRALPLTRLIYRHRKRIESALG